MIQQAIEAWVERGRRRNAVKTNNIFVLRYGRRFRLVSAVNLVFFASAFVFGLIPVALRLPGIPSYWGLFIFVFGGLTLFASTYLVYAITSRVEISKEHVAVHCFGLVYSVCHKDKLVTAYKSRAHKSVVLVSDYGKKTRVSTEFDGLVALVAWLCLRPDAVLTDSIRDWMRLEWPDLGTPLTLRQWEHD